MSNKRWPSSRSRCRVNQTAAAIPGVLEGRDVAAFWHDMRHRWSGGFPQDARARYAEPLFDFDPDEDRDDHGRWTSGGGTAGTGNVPASGVTGGAFAGESVRAQGRAVAAAAGAKNLPEHEERRFNRYHAEAGQVSSFLSNYRVVGAPDHLYNCVADANLPAG